eukprot:1109197-Pyramimonas_sp.AAC.1
MHPRGLNWSWRSAWRRALAPPPSCAAPSLCSNAPANDGGAKHHFIIAVTTQSTSIAPFGK